MKRINSIGPLVRAVHFKAIDAYYSLRFALLSLFGNVQAQASPLWQTAHIGPASLAGATFAVSATVPATFDQAGFTASGLDYVTIGNVKNFPKIGAKRPVSKWTPISGAAKTIVGTPDFGAGDMTVADVPADAGNVILKASELGTSGQPYNLAMKITFADGEVMYLFILISAYEYSFGDNGAVKEITATVNVEQRPVNVAAP